MSGRALIIDDDRDMLEMLRVDLTARGIASDLYSSAEGACEALRRSTFDVVLADVNMPGMNGLQLCEWAAMNRPHVPVIVITAFGNVDTAVAAIRAGAYDFVTKPVDLDLLYFAVDRAIRHGQMRDKIALLEQELDLGKGCGELLGNSKVMRDLYDRIARIAGADCSVLISGESGSGKELVANALHRSSERRSSPFVAINCAALPAPLLESELFGHLKGAFTDARETRKGLFLEADGGTLFLDEIGDLPLELQPKLLRALESKTIRPVGGVEEKPFDVRILAATNKDLEEAVEAGDFREDLFYRINVVQIDVPPLRIRETDALLLADHFLKQLAPRSGKRIEGLSGPVAEQLLAYHWPGNVRELRNTIERAVALARCDKIVMDDLPEKLLNNHRSPTSMEWMGMEGLGAMEDLERRYIVHVLKTFDGNKSLAARTLGFDRKTLYRKLKHYGIEIG